MLYKKRGELCSPRFLFCFGTCSAQDFDEFPFCLRQAVAAAMHGAEAHIAGALQRNGNQTLVGVALGKHAAAGGYAVCMGHDIISSADRAG